MILRADALFHKNLRKRPEDYRKLDFFWQFSIFRMLYMFPNWLRSDEIHFLPESISLFDEIDNHGNNLSESDCLIINIVYSQFKTSYQFHLVDVLRARFPPSTCLYTHRLAYGKQPGILRWKESGNHWQINFHISYFWYH